jgi:hypothetical protein
VPRKTSDWEQNEIIYAHIISKAWLNAAFRDRLIKNPERVLKRNGFDIPDNTTVEIVPGATSMEWNPISGELKLPLPDRGDKVSDDDVISLEVSTKALGICCFCC